MTSLIDVIFLLLLFFMLSSTFTRFAEVPLGAASTGGGASPERSVFVSVGADVLRVNGTPIGMPDLEDTFAPLRVPTGPTPVLLAASGDVTAQRLTDVLAGLHRISGLSITVLEAS